MVDACDAAFMARALFLAERGRGRTSPNPIVGAVVVDADGVVVGQGAHLVAGGPHAEVAALDAAGAAARGATLYCTLEPCAHMGRTGPCVERIVSAGITRVVAGTIDVNPRVAGRGFSYLRTHGIDVKDGVCEDAARAQLAPFFTWVTAGRPWVVAKTAVSRDGFVGRRDRPVRLTGAVADRYFHRQRAEVDAILVGADTVLVDDPRLTARGAYRFRPLTRVVVDWRARVPLDARLFSTLSAGPVIMVMGADRAGVLSAREAALGALGVDVEWVPMHDLRELLSRLAHRGILSVLVEGGPRLQSACVDADLVDGVQWVETGEVLGDGVPVSPALAAMKARTRQMRRRTLGDDVLMEFDIHRTLA